MIGCSCLLLGVIRISGFADVAHCKSSGRWCHVDLASDILVIGPDVKFGLPAASVLGSTPVHSERVRSVLLTTVRPVRAVKTAAGSTACAGRRCRLRCMCKQEGSRRSAHISLPAARNHHFTHICNFNFKPEAQNGCLCSRGT